MSSLWMTGYGQGLIRQSLWASSRLAVDFDATQSVVRSAAGAGIGLEAAKDSSCWGGRRSVAETARLHEVLS